VTVSTAADVFFDSLATELLAQTPALAARWTERAAAAAPRPAESGGGAESSPAVDAEAVVRALVASLRKDARWPGEVMRLGWDAGADAHHAGLAPHHLLTDAELLVAVVLAAAEQCVRQGGCEAHRTATAADGIAAARQLQRAGALYTHAAVASFLHAIVTALRAHYRVLRHDLRNPVGTIRGALSLMEDETVPVESRLGPQVRAMVARNALSLDNLISTGLDDLTAESLLTAPHEMSVRDLALATRRALREPARLADCDIVVGDDLPTVRVDAAAVELTLSAVLLAGIACAVPGDVFRVEHGRAAAPGSAQRPPDLVTLRVVHERGEPGGELVWDLHGLELAASVAAEFGGCIGAAPSEDPGYVPERRRVRRITRRADPAPLVAVAALYLELPVLPAPGVDTTPDPRPLADRQAASRSASATTGVPSGRERAAAGVRSAGHQREDLAPPN
jgi:signal transduction histidine kinase